MTPQSTPFPFKPRLSLKSKAVFRYRFGVIRRGKALLRPWRENLIQDCGLDGIGSTYSWAGAFVAGLLGDTVSPVPVRRDSSPINFTSSGTTVTASGTFFSLDDVGRLIKFNDMAGTEVYITAFTSATIVTVSAAPGVTATTGTVWYVNETNLSNLYASTTSYGTSGTNGTTASGNVVTLKRTLVFPTITVPTTLTEIGFNSAAANTAVFDRDIITGGFPVITDDIPTAICELIITWEPHASVSVGNVATGFDSSGDMILSGLYAGVSGGGISYVAADGSTVAGTLDPDSVSYMGLFTAPQTLPAFSNAAGPDYTGDFSGPYTGTLQAYSNGNFFRDTIFSAGLLFANSTLYGFALLNGASGNNGCWVQVLTTPFTKTNVQVLGLTLRKSWQRILVN